MKGLLFSALLFSPFAASQLDIFYSTTPRSGGNIDCPATRTDLLCNRSKFCQVTASALTLSCDAIPADTAAENLTFAAFDFSSGAVRTPMLISVPNEKMCWEVEADHSLTLKGCTSETPQTFIVDNFPNSTMFSIIAPSGTILPVDDTSGALLSIARATSSKDPNVIDLTCMYDTTGVLYTFGQ